ncbi:NlpC/P60 family protein [Croceicoccus sp. F390]|uniref:NlpC/P60 family protein n=1 Tax=Croceicoccus esteveae TaxID=3075597 RepID=A0ABU2ZIV1_9SPHN|nr:NlpC/P60 family protein [Croceicoccus sp. F390]MDT0576536.1 NlpC/P60 family protein [Croceicoccus sp. F390]
MIGQRMAQAAESLVGTPFRLCGRDPATGLDCVGLIGAAAARAGRPLDLPVSYSLRNLNVDRLLEHARGSGLVRLDGEARRVGDILLFRLGPVQLHLALFAGPNCYIHAHAGLRRVVKSEAEQGWHTERHWRLTISQEGR